MEKLVFDCEVISPMFLYGSNQNNPEFRAPSLKGALRFWWRAVQAEKDIFALNALEGKIFGGTGSKVDIDESAESNQENSLAGRSSFTIRMINKRLDTRSVNPLPHKPSGYQSRAIVNANFVVECSFIRLPEEFSLAQLKALFELTSLLGGLGRRSRRGFGSFRILRCNGQQSDIAELKQEDVLPQILKRVNILSNHKFVLNNGIIKLENNVKSDYPYIEAIALGKQDHDVNVLLERIGKSSHEHNSKFTGDGGRDRLASPEYVSLIKGENGKIWPIITSLHLAFGQGTRPPYGKDTRREFREAILS